MSREWLNQRFNLPTDRDYFLTPAARRPNKNIARLIRAFAAIDDPSRPLLLLPGADAGSDEDLVQLIASLNVADRVQLLGW